MLTEEPKEPLYLNSFCFGFRLNDTSLLLPEFSKYLFRSEALRKQIIRTASGVTRFNVSKEKMKKVRIPIPPLSFQNEIVRILLDKRNIHNNRLQVINQYETDEGKYKNRYDVTVLVNGLPLVHVEMKRRGVAIREAFNQINRYQRDSFWSGSGLFEYVQVFVISNGTHTKYYSNTTRNAHIIEVNGGRNTKKTSNTFEFTNYWADANNKVIADLVDFTKTFLPSIQFLIS